MRFFLESREFGESRVYQVWSPIGSTLHRLSSPKRKGELVQKTCQANPSDPCRSGQKSLCGQTDFSVVSLRKSVAIRFLYPNRCQQDNWTQLRSLVTPSRVMYSEEGERKNLLTAFEKQKFYSRTELLLISICCTDFKFLDCISGENFPPTTTVRPWESCFPNIAEPGFPHILRGSWLKTRFQGFIANGETPQFVPFQVSGGKKPPIHAWYILTCLYIYIHLADFYAKCRETYIVHGCYGSCLL